MAAPISVSPGSRSARSTVEQLASSASSSSRPGSTSRKKPDGASLAVGQRAR